MVERVRYSLASSLGIIVVATTVNQEDDRVEALCKREGILCFRGHETDLLDRHYQAAQTFNPVGCHGEPVGVVKIPSDCPLIDPDIINRVL